MIGLSVLLTYWSSYVVAKTVLGKCFGSDIAREKIVAMVMDFYS